MGGGKGGEVEWEKLGEGRRKKSEKKLGEVGKLKLEKKLGEG
jgi:hypothetical protein